MIFGWPSEYCPRTISSSWAGTPATRVRSLARASVTAPAEMASADWREVKR